MQCRFNYVTKLGVTFLVLASPVFVQASSCSEKGYTVVFVNGVFDTEDEAKYDAKKLGFILGSQFNNQPVTVQVGYNQTHLAGLGDLVEAYFPSFDQYDLNTILLQIYPEVNTRKLLLVGHSQGSVYANRMYEYLTAHGEPTEAVGVYAVATPESYVAGGGKYLTYALDSVIGSLKELGKFKPLPANVDILDLPSGPDIPVRGHSFIDQYLAAFSTRIVADINGELAQLQPTQASDTGGCFDPPPRGLGYKVQQVTFAIADPTAGAIKVGGVAAYKGAVAVIHTAGSLAQAGLDLFGGAVATVRGIIPGFATIVTDTSHTEKNFGVLKVLYGSSLSQKELSELLGSKQGAAAVTAPSGIVAGVETGPAPNTTPPETPPTAPPPVSTPTPPAPLHTPAASHPDLGTTPFVAPVPPVVPPPAQILFDASTTVPVLSVSECSASVSADYCSITTTTVTLSWSALAGAVEYGIVVNGTQTSTTSATGAMLILSNRATTTLAVIAYDAVNTATTSAAQDVYVAVPIVFISQGSPVHDSLDTFNSAGWGVFGGSVKEFEFDDGTDGPCFLGGCVIGIGRGVFDGRIPRMYVESGPGLSAGAFTVYAKAKSGFFANPIPVISVCEAPNSGCLPERLDFVGLIPLDNTWHQYYVAWRQGISHVEKCMLQDDTNSDHCTWRDTEIALGTLFDGVALWTTNGFRSDDIGGGANLWFDEVQ